MAARSKILSEREKSHYLYQFLRDKRLESTNWNLVEVISAHCEGRGIAYVIEAVPGHSITFKILQGDYRERMSFPQKQKLVRVSTNGENNG